MSATSEVKTVVLSFPKNKLFNSSKIYSKHFKDINEYTYYKILERLVKYEELMKAGKGVYYVPKSTKFGVIPINEQKVLKQFIKNETNGMEIGYGMFNKLGLTTQISKKRECLCNTINSSQKKMGSLYFYYEGIMFTKRNKAFIEVLEVLQHYASIEDFSHKTFVRYIKEFSMDYRNECLHEILKTRKYRKSTLAFLREILEFYEVPNDINQYLSPLSKYSIPSWREDNEFTLA